MKIICRCFGVTEQAIVDLVVNQQADFAYVQSTTKATTRCGMCREAVLRVVTDTRYLQLPYEQRKDFIDGILRSSAAPLVLIEGYELSWSYSEEDEYVIILRFIPVVAEPRTPTNAFHGFLTKRIKQLTHSSFKVIYADSL